MVSFVLICKNSLYIQDISPLLDMCIKNTLSQYATSLLSNNKENFLRSS